MKSSSLQGKRTAVYARYSSDNQHQASLDDQVRRAAEYAGLRGGTLDPSLIFRDGARSGTTVHGRPALRDLLRAVDSGEIDVVLTEDVSRLSRDMSDAGAIFKRLKYRDVVLIGLLDGVDSREKHAKMLFGMRALMSDMFIDDLSEKTFRGQEGCALSGFSTGGRILGYSTRPVPTPDGKVRHALIVNDEDAEIVRRIFKEYAQGNAALTIATKLTLEGVEVPRPNKQKRCEGWHESTVRAILHNEMYRGVRYFGRRRWRRDPDTGLRRPGKRPPEEVRRTEHPELRIIDETLWQAVQARMLAVRAKYSGKPTGSKAPPSPGRKTSYPFSGLLKCATCGSPMVISGGVPTRHYRCGDLHKRGLCKNRLSVKEPLVREKLLAALLECIASPWTHAYVRKRLAEGSGRRRSSPTELEKVQARLGRAERRLAGFVDMWADGHRDETVRDRWDAAKAEVTALQRAAASLAASEHQTPEVLPLEDVAARALDLRRLAVEHPIEAREVIRRLLRNGQVEMAPQADGSYVAKTEVLPLVLIAADKAASPRSASQARASYTSLGCAGRI